MLNANVKVTHQDTWFDSIPIFHQDIEQNQCLRRTFLVLRWSNVPCIFYLNPRGLKVLQMSKCFLKHAGFLCLKECATHNTPRVFFTSFFFQSLLNKNPRINAFRCMKFNCLLLIMKKKERKRKGF